MIPIGTNLQRTKFPRAVLGIIAVNIVVFGIELALSRDAIIWTFQNLGFSPDTGNPASPVTSLFLHADIYHIAFNMLFLWIFGGPVEERIGARNFLTYYFGAGLAAGYLNAVMEIISRPDNLVPCIGASGAISGIMALFLYRCFYAKLRMVITPFLLPWKVNVPVIPLVLLWLFQDVILGVLSIKSDVGTGTAHWAHVGGFAFGIVIGRLNRYGQEGRAEHLRSRILKKLSDGGWQDAEKELLRLLETTPNDPEVNHDLARLYAQKGETDQAEHYYTTAVQRYFEKNPLAAAYTVIEYETALARPMPTQNLLKAAEALIAGFHYEDAHRALASLASLPDPSGALVEKGLYLYAKLSLHLSDESASYQALKLLATRFPQSRYKAELKVLQAKQEGPVFPPAPEQSAPPAPEGEESQEEKEAGQLGAIETIERVFADPAFWIALLVLKVFFPLFLPGLSSGRLAPLYVVGAAFLIAFIRSTMTLGDLLSLNTRQSDEEARREVESSRWFDDAVRAEKSERYADAASLYEKLLAREKGNILARFNLARLYHKKLEDAAKALRHYRLLMEQAPKDHPFHSEATNAVQELRMNTGVKRS